MEEHISETGEKAVRCRNLFKKLLLKYHNLLFPGAEEKMEWVLDFLHQSENSYVIREHELKKLAEEGGGAQVATVQVDKGVGARRRKREVQGDHNGCTGGGYGGIETETDIESFCKHGGLYWQNCYGSGAKYLKYTIPEAVKHPAKMSWELLERIFKHLESMNLLTHDSIVIDFMSGTGRTNTMAALRRYRTISVELEPHFIEMMAGYDCDGKTITDFRIEPCPCKSDVLHKPHVIRGGLFEVECTGNPRIVPVCRCGEKRHHKKHHVIGNKELLEQVTGRKVHWDILQGDARELTKLLVGNGLAGVVSPPYTSQMAFQDKDFMIKSAEERSNRMREGIAGGHFGSPEALKRYAEKIMETYSPDPRNIGNLPDTPLAGIISPPYAQDQHSRMTEKCAKMFEGRSYKVGKEYSLDSDNIGNLKDAPLVGIMSPPYSRAQEGGGIAINGYRGSHMHEQGKNQPDKVGQRCGYMKEVHGSDPANIGNLPDRSLAAIISPPYQDTAMPMGCPSHIRKLAREGKWDEAIELEREEEAKQAKKGNKFAVSTDETIRKKIEMALEREKGNYSENSNNIGNLPDRPIVGITSPPHADAISASSGGPSRLYTESEPSEGYEKLGASCQNVREYSGSENNIGNQQGESYLSAMFKVYQQAYLCGISPLVVVTKNPTRNGKLRRLDLDTVFLLQQSGYEIFDYHRAVLFEEQTQATLDGETKKSPKGRLSFFKRLSYSKGTEIARWEDVIFARIP